MLRSRFKKRQTVADSFLRARNEPETSKNEDVSTVIGVHDAKRYDTTHEGHPCVLSQELFSKRFKAGQYLRVVPQSVPQKSFVAQVCPATLVTLKTGFGVSISEEFAKELQLPSGRQEAKVVPVSKDEAALDYVVVELNEQFVSRRDLWHLQLALQMFGEVLYSSLPLPVCTFWKMRVSSLHRDQSRVEGEEKKKVQEKEREKAERERERKEKETTAGGGGGGTRDATPPPSLPPQAGPQPQGPASGSVGGLGLGALHKDRDREGGEEPHAVAAPGGGGTPGPGSGPLGRSV
eukprot:Cvel_1337.t1-p1 / transcript=Cvel_1337.t1 / gene=Cvel_1337 / organism=Chromera_velia_CCMP2878 / gene_product=hypothetical protein / transcript_product=hypothetical protein / location=Cvel_scaffold46:77-2899(-) / protein_length=291 / sequence_SO=supercontig / SO=protein_coding / is_pseudo=false